MQSSNVFEGVLALVIFALLAQGVIVVVWLADMLFPKQMAKPLEVLHTELVRHNAAIMTVVLGLMTMVVIGSGISGH